MARSFAPPCGSSRTLSEAASLASWSFMFFNSAARTALANCGYGSGRPKLSLKSATTVPCSRWGMPNEERESKSAAWSEPPSTLSMGSA